MKRWPILFITATIVAVWCLSALLIFKTMPTWESRGQFGDMFGGVNALFSGLAFAGVVIALLIQREELQLQREEIRQAREEQSRLVQAQKEGSEALRQQFLIQTLAARVSILQITVSEASSALERGNAAVIGALHAGQSGVKSEDFAPGAAQRLKKARDEVAVLLQHVEELSKHYA